MTTNTDIATRLIRLETSIVSDILDDAGFPEQVLSRSIVMHDGRTKIAGAAQCFRGAVRVEMAAAPAGRHRPNRAAMENNAQPGVVVVLATGEYEGGAVLGGLLAKKLQARSCAGFVTDGLVRDAAEITEIGLPLAALGVTPINSGRRFDLVEENVAVPMPGQDGGTVVVNPDDFILGDRDGIIVIPRHIVEPIMEMAEELVRKEGLIQRDMESGMSRDEAFRRHPRFSHIKWLRS